VDPDLDVLPHRRPGRHLDQRIPAGTSQPVDPQTLHRVLTALRDPVEG
jgi:hypothetical protein